MTGKEYADIIDGFDVEHNSKLSGGNYLFLQVKETFWDTWE